MAQQGPPGQGMQDLGQSTFHAGAFTGRHNDYVYIDRHENTFLMQKLLRYLLRYLPIIGTLLLGALLTGCGATKLAYNNAPSLSYWYLDAYFDFDAAQTQRVRKDLDTVHAWHRKNELPVWTQQISALKARALQDADADTFCKLGTSMQQSFTSMLDQMVPTLTVLAPQLSEAQLQHIGQQYEKKNAEWREKYVDGTASKQLDQRTKRTVERAEKFYGSLRKDQIALLRKELEASSYDPQAMYREKLRQHQDVLQTLRNNPTQASLRALLQRSMSPPDASYRQAMDKVTREGCSMMAALHNSMTAAQRKELQTTLQGYEDDFRSLQTGQTTP
jgi:hypothetical protein